MRVYSIRSKCRNMARVDLAPPQILHTYKVSGNLIENATRRQIIQTYAPQALKGRDLIGSCRQTQRSEVRPTARMRVYSIRSKCRSIARVDFAFLQILHTYKVSGNLIENATRRQITQTYAPQALKGRDLIGSCRQTQRSEVRPTARIRVYSIRSKCRSMARVDLAPPQIIHTYTVSGNLIENATRRHISQSYAPQALK